MNWLGVLTVALGFAVSKKAWLGCRAEAPTELESASAAELRRDSLRQDLIGGGRRLEMDIVSHDVKKFFGLLLKKNGYVLEQLYSPLVVHTTPEHAELKAICNPRQRDTGPHPQLLSHRMLIFTHKSYCWTPYD